MPLYEYQCQACHKTHEFLQKHTDEPKIDCPSCNQPALNKLVSRAGFQLKGTGWYVTDFKGQKENKKEPVKAGAEEKPTSTSDKGSPEASKNPPKTDNPSD